MLTKKPKFMPGKNIAMKVPPYEFEKTVKFYMDIIGLKLIRNEEKSVAFKFGNKNLWIDNVPGISHAEIWLEVFCSDLKAAKKYLEENDINRCDYIEPLPKSFKGFWIASPSNVIHLVTQKES